MSQVAVAFAQTRHQALHGLQAKLTPMRFEGGALTTRRRGRTWTVQRLFHGQREMLYILTFYLPRFLDQSFREKLITVFHELYHISPACSTATSGGWRGGITCTLPVSGNTIV